MKKKYDEEVVTNRYCRECGRDYVREHFQFIDLCNTCYDKIHPPRGLEYIRQWWKEKIIPKYPRLDGETNKEWIARVHEELQKNPIKRRTRRAK
jgi:hypothetical protein